MTNWQAVAYHLATEVMDWRVSGETYVSKYNYCKGFVKDWRPYEKWDQIGRVIDEMKKHNLYLSLWYSIYEESFDAHFSDYLTGKTPSFTTQDTEQKAIALAAALATGYVEKEKTEAEILLEKLCKESLFYYEKGAGERILEFFEQSFERVREGTISKEAIRKAAAVDYERLCKVFRAAVRLRRKLVWHDNLMYSGKVTTAEEQSKLEDLLYKTRWVENEWEGQV